MWYPKDKRLYRQPKWVYNQDMIALRQFFLKIKLKLQGYALVGRDVYDNAYYQLGKRRMVVYAGTPEPSSVCAQWHAWLHKGTDLIPDEAASKQQWQRKHVMNRTGTIFAHTPPGFSARETVDSHTSYVPWDPHKRAVK